MGRRAKHSTHAGTLAASKRRQQDYFQSDRFVVPVRLPIYQSNGKRFRGRELRSLQNRRAYLKRKCNSSTTSTPPPLQPSSTPPLLQPPNLPDDLYDMGNLPLPTSYEFKDALESGYFYEDSDWNDEALASWLSPPPYTLLPSGDPERFLDVLMGYRLRMLKEEEVARLDRFEGNASHDSLAEVHAELVVHYNRWKELRIAVGNMKRGLGACLGVSFVQWEARRVCLLEQDFSALRHGLDALFRLFVDRWTAIL
ncbi:hypothetical protein H0H92_013031 [Tricholoma furcatifolium]|nr:hypothetical protein H0H92_013031 [Tricholoma furcatifolium]